MTLVAAVVPSYRPRLDEIAAIVDALRGSEVPVLVADDASACTSDAILRQLTAAGAHVLRHRRNAGIARSLNAGLAFARERAATWLLTVDQDSALPPEYCLRVLTAAEAAARVLGADRIGAVAAGCVDDAGGVLGYPVTQVDGLPTTQEVIQTGTLWNVAGLAAAGGFDETFGIDAVDAAACVRLRAAGRHIVLVPGLTLGHRLGDGRQVSVLGRPVVSSGHSPERRTTIVRNRLRLAPEELRQSPTHAFRTLRRVAMNTALAVTVEDDRWAKAKASARGLFPPGRG